MWCTLSFSDILFNLDGRVQSVMQFCWIIVTSINTITLASAGIPAGSSKQNNFFNFLIMLYNYVTVLPLPEYTLYKETEN